MNDEEIQRLIGVAVSRFNRYGEQPAEAVAEALSCAGGWVRCADVLDIVKAVDAATKDEVSDVL